MIIWNDKELEYLNKYIEDMKESSKNPEFKDMFTDDIKRNIDVVLENWKDINEVDLLNALLFDLLDEMNAHLWLMGYKTREDLEELEYMTDEDISIYLKMYKLEDDGCNS